MSQSRKMKRYHKDLYYLHQALGETQTVLQHKIKQRVIEVEGQSLNNEDIINKIKQNAKDLPKEGHYLKYNTIKNITTLDDLDITASCNILLYKNKYSLPEKNKRERNIIDTIRLDKNKYTSHASISTWNSTDLIDIRNAMTNMQSLARLYNETKICRKIEKELKRYQRAHQKPLFISVSMIIIALLLVGAYFILQQQDDATLVDNTTQETQTTKEQSDNQQVKQEDTTSNDTQVQQSSYSGMATYRDLTFEATQNSSSSYTISITNNGATDYAIGWVGYTTRLQSANQTLTSQGHMHVTIPAGSSTSYSASFDTLSEPPVSLIVCNVSELSSTGLPATMTGSDITINLQ